MLAACAGVEPTNPGAPPHHRVGGFANTNPAFARAGFWMRTTFFASRVVKTTFAPRRANLPRVANDGRALRDNHGHATLTWIGHSTFLIQLDGVNVLTDPQWAERASPVAFAGPRRLSRPGLAFEDLPLIHAVVISHDHYDHLDTATIRQLALEYRPRFFVPLGLKRWFANLGITDVEELDWWESGHARGLAFTCLPAQHFSGRGLWGQNRTLWSGWAILGREKRFYFAGDTGYYDAFKVIGARLGPFDVAAVSIGAYDPPAIMQFTHTTPEEALRIFADVRATNVVPMHWGTFDLTDEPLAEPAERLTAEGRRLGIDPERIWILKHGETRTW